jgi:hypothetical protein
MQTLKRSVLLILALAACALPVVAQTEEPSCSIQAWVKDRDPNGLNVRDKPAVTGKIVAKLKVDAESEEILVNVIGYSNGWLKISGAEKLAGGSVFDGIGWVSAKMIETGTKGSPNYDSPAPIYAVANTSSKKAGTIPSEALIQIDGFKCGWIKALYKGKTGWLRVRNICGSPVTTCN